MRPKSLFHITVALVFGTLSVSAQDWDGGGHRKWINGYYPQWKVYSNFYPKLLVTSGTAAKLNYLTYAFAVILVNLEMTDKLRIVILRSIPVGAYNFGTVRDSLGVIPEPSGAPG